MNLTVQRLRASQTRIIELYGRARERYVYPVRTPASASVPLNYSTKTVRLRVQDSLWMYDFLCFNDVQSMSHIICRYYACYCDHMYTLHKCWYPIKRANNKLTNRHNISYMCRMSNKILIKYKICYTKRLIDQFWYLMYMYVNLLRTRQEQRQCSLRPNYSHWGI